MSQTLRRNLLSKKKEDEVVGKMEAGVELKNEKKSSQLLAWRELWVSMGGKDILRSLSGWVSAGQFLAILGPSGSGKSTLLDALAMQLPKGAVVRGDVVLDGGTRTREGFWDVVSYVPQREVLLPHMTALESLRFVARLRLAEDVDGVCWKLLTTVGLDKVANVPCGGTLSGGLEIRGMSGGERKRLTIAQGLVAETTKLVLIDEPTTGLDAAAQLQVIQVLKNLDQVAVCCTIHNPRSTIWASFDDIMLLSAGRLVYRGPTHGAVPAMQSFGYLLDVSGSPADLVVDLVSIDFPTKPPTLFGEKTMHTVADVDAVADAIDAAAAKDDSISSSSSSSSSAKNNKHQFKVGFGVQYRVLVHRIVVSHLRHPANAFARCLLTFMSPLFAAFVYGRQHRVAGLPKTIRDYVRYVDYFGAQFINICNNCLVAWAPIGCLLYDRQFFSREVGHRLYSVAAYYLAYATVESLFCLALFLPSSALYAYLLHFQVESGAPAPLIFGLLSATAGLTYSHILLFACALSPSIEVALCFSSGFFISGLIAGGYPISIRSYNAPWVRWLSNLRPIQCLTVPGNRSHFVKKITLSLKQQLISA